MAIPGRSFLFYGLLAAATLGRAASPPNAYVGSAACKECHEEIAGPFFKNPHFKSVASGKARPEDTGCEGCHGPGKAHVDSFGLKTDIVAFSTLSPGKAQDACLRCHASDLTRANFRQSSHGLNDVSCTNCHSIHWSATPKSLLKAKQTQLCEGCHQDVRAQFEMPFKHRVNEGVMNCTDCHNPHGAFDPTWRNAARPRMVAQAPVNEEPCLKCHADKRGPFAYEHPPVRVEGCESCHFPHGSTNSRLLRRPVVFTMCLECHNGAPSFGLRGTGDPRPSASHNMADPRYQNCTACHVRIHGSNSDYYFLR